MSILKQRRSIYIRGIVQGVGFRPFVYAQAVRYGLIGWVRNDSDGVTIEVEGSEGMLEAFQHALAEQPPPLARIDDIRSTTIPTQGGDGFQIIHSQQAQQRNTLIAVDAATCEDCLRELFDVRDRRFHYPFINCTNCGPRFTIVADVPYDRANTTMNVFPLCPACQAEYDDPNNRRFHAQPNACPICGPQLRFHVSPHTSLVFQPGEMWEPSEGHTALQRAIEALVSGAIVAIKGLGGYHLACDAYNPEAVQRLRQHKQRESKPFALMVADLSSAQHICQINNQEAALLSSQRRPIVLLSKRDDLQLPEAIAPGYKEYGLMLPYTPLHHLLLQGCIKHAPPDRPPILVMTSGNRSDEPIATDDQDAFIRLADIADAFLSHNRAILTRCDDSVVRQTIYGQQFIRRSRGYVPEPILLDQASPRPLLAYGAHLKNTFCLVRDRMAVISHHIGDLENLETLQSFREGIDHLGRLFEIVPELLVHDLHPGYLATQEAMASLIGHTMAVQHHHAHIASVLAEHQLHEPVIGIAADGTGYGLDGSIWGGEILLAEHARFERLGHLATVALPGGEQAIRQPWRVAASYLWQIYGPQMYNLELPFIKQLDMPQWHILQHMLQHGINSPKSSSIGRLFDAVAALIGLRAVVFYEGQAAIELEAIAERIAAPYPMPINQSEPYQIDVQPMFEVLIADLQRGISPPVIAGRFHASLAAGLALASQRAGQQYGIRKIALSGGVFQNRLLLEQLVGRLQGAGFDVYINRMVPPNDAGISFGQAIVAMARLRGGA